MEHFIFLSRASDGQLLRQSHVEVEPPNAIIDIIRETDAAFASLRDCSSFINNILYVINIPRVCYRPYGDSCVDSVCVMFTATLGTERACVCVDTNTSRTHGNH